MIKLVEQMSDCAGCSTVRLIRLEKAFDDDTESIITNERYSLYFINY